MKVRSKKAAQTKQMGFMSIIPVLYEAEIGGS
jgi:hypothetical protein